jgi:hypothetical protein
MRPIRQSPEGDLRFFTLRKVGQRSPLVWSQEKWPGTKGT